MYKHSTIHRTLSRRLAALLAALALLAAMALPVYAEVDLLPDAPDEVELLEDEPGTASGEDTALPEQNAATPVPDAATPEPEQSAEPEQPAPTETPEPTAEPTPTPEPAATATATPVPTVTPTATPEPTEQPQKMYAARSVDNVQAVSASADTYTLYFAVPDGWSDCTVVKIYAADGGNPSSDHKYFLDMQEVDETKDRRKIYSVVLNHDDHYHNGGLNGLEFRGYKSKGEAFENGNPADTAYKVVIAEVDRNLGSKWMSFNSGDTNNYIGGNYYDGNKGGGWNRDDWTTYTVGHKHFAGQKMAFENKTSATLTNVKAWFYEPDKNGDLIPVGNPIPLNSIDSGNSIASGSTVTFTIPNDYCSFVRFTEGDNDTEISEYYNFYNEKVTGENQKRFQYSEQCYCYMYNGIGDATWGRPGATRIYYDATFSKMALNGDTGDFSIPKANKETIYFRIKGGDDVLSESGTLVKDGTNENLYYVDIPQGYNSIIFSGEEISNDNTTKEHGLSTAWLTIPTDDKNCFYADTNDDAVYGKGPRSGYWDKKGEIRDAEKGKTNDPVVNVPSAAFTPESDTKYINTTLYDYYTDWELNGNNRDKYNGDNGASQRNWVTFRQFDQALSDYYQSDKKQTVLYPIYTGHFQPDEIGGELFSNVASALNLYGWDQYNTFMAVNNSYKDIDGKINLANPNDKEDKNNYVFTFQGLVSDTLNKDGNPTLYNTNLAEPHFNRAFLEGDNSKNAVLGKVYENVDFPFTKEDVFKNGVSYWHYESNDKSLFLKQKQGMEDQYFLQQPAETVVKDKMVSDNAQNVNSSSNPSGTYGFFPFNEGSKDKRANTYNYGFGAKLQFDFTLTDDGQVLDNKGSKVPIQFFFSGDDDVWVYIDNELALDVGGAHGEASGLLEFGPKNSEGKNTYTAYVSNVKAGNKKQSYKNGANKSVTYLDSSISFKYQSEEKTLTPGKHTLRLFYMERGMWESNMAIAFNFPDNNELQVQKEVDLSNVNPDFKNCFKNQKIFNFTIQNQATHYGKKDAADPDTSGTPSQEVDLTADGNSIAAATPGNEHDYIFRRETNPWPDSGNKDEQVLHWYARYTDTEPVSAKRNKRYGILTLQDPINIQGMRFLTFQVYAAPDPDGGGALSLNNLYLELLDEKDVQKGSLGTTGINGATYGSVELKTGEWVTVKLDLNKMKEQGKFSGNVQTIRVGDNYSRHIYFRNFTFIPKAVPSTMTGFTTDQKEIPDYGSVESGQLQNATNAQYTSTKDKDTQLVDEDGRFVLEDGETVTFSDQFRRGSYISLKEDLNSSLYDTTWTVYENGQEVTSTEPTGSASHVTLEKPRSLESQNDPAQGPDDGRTEVYVDEDGVKNDGYKANKKPDDTNTIVFRSYMDPDETSSKLTKLKVKYVNTVKTGGLKIQKNAAAGEKDTIKGIYTFKVTFNNVGGEGLEEKSIEKTVQIDMSTGNNTATITGIPVGTRYTIEEVAWSDGSRLQSVTVPDGNSAHVINNNTMVEGVIVESKDPQVTAIFTNTQRKLINIEFDKLWKDANDTDIGTAKQPDEIYIQLQRRLKDDTAWTSVNYPADSTQDYVTITRDDNGWQHTFSNLDQYPVGGNANNNYIYRIVEGTVKDGSFTQANGTITINGNTYVVTAKATPNSETNSAGSSTGNTATVTTDGTITGGSGKIVLTNTLQNPKFNLDILKKSADEPDTPLKGVEFTLEKLAADGKTVDTRFPARIGITNAQGEVKEKGSNGNATGKNIFHDLEAGAYRLTETKTAEGYNLLSAPILVTFDKDGTCTLNGSKIEVSTDDKPTEFTKNADSYTLKLTVLNRKTPALPHTGADAPSLWLLIGLPLAVAGLLILVFRYNKKGGRTR